MSQSLELTPVNATIEESSKDVLEVINARNQLFDKVLQVAIQSTGNSDWVDQQGKPYLQSSGAEKVARRFGVKICDVTCEREDLEDEKGKYYLYTFFGKAYLGEKEHIEAIGTCSSRDKFFGTTRGSLKLIQDVDLPNIKKKAYTNLFVNAVTRLLGLRNLTWDELSKFGISKDGKSSVKYDSRATKFESSKKVELDASQAKKPFWVSEYEGKKFLFVSIGKHFTSEFLLNLNFKKSEKKENLFFKDFDSQSAATIEEEYMAAEALLSKEGGAS